MNTSMLYTMGLALTRAADLGYGVSILVESQWLHGTVAAHDGVGLVLEQADGSHSVVRTERIAAVTVHSASPYRETDDSRPLVAAC